MRARLDKSHTVAPERSVFAAMLALPVQYRYAFWLPAAFVFGFGMILASRNYLNPQPNLPRDASVAPVVVLEVEDDDQTEPATFAGSAAELDETEEPQSEAKLARFGLSTAAVALASLIAGFSMAQLLRRPVHGFRTAQEVEDSLGVPVFGVVPISTGR